MKGGGKYNFGRILPTDIGPTAGQRGIMGAVAGAGAGLDTFFKVKSFADQQKQQEILNRQVQERLRLAGRGQDLQLRGQDISLAQLGEQQANRQQRGSQFDRSLEATQGWREEQTAQTELQRLVKALHPSQIGKIQGATTRDQVAWVRENADRLQAEAAQLRQREMDERVRLAGRESGARAGAGAAARFRVKSREQIAKAQGYEQWQRARDGEAGPPTPYQEGSMPFVPSASIDPTAIAGAAMARGGVQDTFRQRSEARKEVSRILADLSATRGEDMAPVDFARFQTALGGARGQTVSTGAALQELSQYLSESAALRLTTALAQQGDPEAQEILRIHQEMLQGGR